MIDLMVNGFVSIWTPSTLFLMVFGVVIGILFGALPGITIGLAVTLGLTLSFGMDSNTAFALMLSLYIGGVSGGLISAILLNIPGTANSFATTWDGHPMAMKGEAGKALGTGIFFSFFGTLVGIAVMMFLSITVSSLAIKLKPFDFFALCLFALSLAASLTGRSFAKGLVACAIGLSLGLIGVAPIDGFSRFTFGFTQLTSGFDIVPAIVGLFAIPEVLKAGNALAKDVKRLGDGRIKGFGFSLKEFFGQTKNFLVSSVIGIVIGILPGIGGSISNLLAYGAVKNISKYPEKFGTGIMDGVVATETANNATIGGTMIPLLSLGIPGDGTTALLLGALMVHGLTPGPLLMKTHPDFLYVIFASMIVASVMTVIIEYFGLKIFVKLLNIPKYFLLPTVFVFCVVGAFTVNNRIFDMFSLLIFGCIGIILSRCGYPHAPCILGFILGRLVETYLRTGLMMTRGSFWQFFTSPVAAVMMILTVLLFAYQCFRNIRKWGLNRKAIVQEKKLMRIAEDG